MVRGRPYGRGGRGAMLAFLLLWIYFQVSSLILFIGALLFIPNTTYLMWRYHDISARLLLGVVFVRPATGPEPALDGPTMFFCSHRCWGDFFIDNCVVGGATYMARWLAAVAVPLSAILGWFTFTTEPFSRSSANRQRIYGIAQNLNALGHSIICYPEGTRNQAPESKPLKFGLIRYAWRSKIRIQMVMTTNKEKCWNEKAGVVRRSVVCGVFHGPVLEPADFDTIDAWCVGFQEEWDALWKKSADPGPMVPFVPTCRAWHNPSRLVAARRALVAGAAILGVWKVALGH